jgi:uncharacterized protein
MKPQNAIEHTVLEFFAVLGSGDLDGARKLFHPEACWRVMGRGVPGAGVHHGADAILRFIAPVRELFAPGSPVIEMTSLLSRDNLVVMESKGGGFLKDGRPYDNYYVMVVEVRDGLIYELREYMDTYYVSRLLG